MPETPSRGADFAARVREEFDLAEHASELVEEAARLLDRIDALDAVVDEEGVMATSSQGKRAHPALVEARQSRLALHRILISLDLPIEV